MFSNVLSEKDKYIFNQWKANKDKPLFIVGYNGCGKTYWSNKILSGYHIININSDHIKYKNDIINYIKSSLFKKDIFMMISSDKQYKALLIDDIEYFSKSDKPTLSKLYKFTQELNYQHYPVVYVCNEISDKTIFLMKKISYVVEIRYNHFIYKNILKISDKELNKLLQTTKNLHTLISLSNNFKSSNTDKKYSLNDTLSQIIKNKYSYNDLFRLCSSEYSILSLNILENITNILNELDICLLYNSIKDICIDDYLEYKYINCNIDLDFKILYSCIIPLKRILYKQRIKKTSLKYNNYISRSMIQIHNQTILNNNWNLYSSILEFVDKKDIINFKKNIHLIDMKILEKQIKVYNYYYNKKLHKKDILKLIKT